MDSSKFDTSTFVKFAGLSEIDLIITDTGVDPEYMELLEREDVSVETARV